MSDEWSQPEAPPPPMFAGKKERDLVKQVNDELIERVIGQTSCLLRDRHEDLQLSLTLWRSNRKDLSSTNKSLMLL